MAVVLNITPSRFRASGSKLDSQRRYIRKGSSGTEFKFVTSQNMDVSDGGLRYVDPDGNNVDDSVYNGNFSGSAGIGVKV